LKWQLKGAAGSIVQVSPVPKLFADDPFTTLQAVLAGIAIGNMPHGLCWRHIEAGRLVRVLPDWDAGGVTTTILMPHRRGQLPAVRAVVEFVAEGMTARIGFK